MAVGQMPVLAVLLEQDLARRAEPLRADQFRVFVQPLSPAREPSQLLEPAVMPTEVEVQPNVTVAEPLLGQTVFFQLTVQLCAEHKLGRAWIGSADEVSLNQAFLRADAREPSATFFRGQASPVPALLGPPRWWLNVFARDTPAWLTETTGTWTNETLLGSQVVEADVWGARAPLPPTKGAVPDGVEPGRLLRFRAGGGDICGPSDLASRLRGNPGACLELERLPAGRLELSLNQEHIGGPARIKAHWADLTKGEGSGLIPPRLLIDQPLTDDLRSEDVVARIPRELPRFRAPGDPSRAWSLMLIPHWQLHQALEGRQRSPASTPSAWRDPVGELLQHIDHLHVQWVDQPRGGTAEDLMSPFRSPGSWLPGQFPGLWASRTPILLLEDQPGQEVSISQHRAVFLIDGLALQIVGLMLVFLIPYLGAPRLVELWQKPPLERAAFWPGTRPNSRRLEDGVGPGRGTRAGGSGGKE